MTRAVYLILLFFFTTYVSLGAQESTSDNEINLILPDFGNTFIDSCFKARHKMISVIKASDRIEADSILGNSNNAILYFNKWCKTPADRHCFGDWTTALIWELRNELLIKKDGEVVEYVLDPSFKEEQVNWILETYENQQSALAELPTSIFIERHAFNDITQSYRDSIYKEYAPATVFSGSDLDYSKLMHTTLEESILNVHVTLETLERNKANVIYSFVNPETKRVVRKDFREYSINKK